MDDRQRDLDRRIRRAQRKEFFRNLWEARLLIAIGVVMLALIVGGISYNSSQPELEETVLAHVVNDGGLITTRRGSQYHHETVAFDNGATVFLDIPGGDPVRTDAPIKVEVYRKDWGPLHQVTYRFAGYDEAASAS
ncbi:MAG: hypothetical protein R3C46_04195 [Hyphomonadaceae bacterium]